MRLIKLLILLLIPSFMMAQGHVFEKVQDSRARHAVQTMTIAQPAPAALLPATVQEEVEGAMILDLNAEAIQNIRSSHPEALQLSIPLPDAPDVQLELVKNKLLTDDFMLRTSDNPDSYMKYQSGDYYYGYISGSPKSLVALSVFDDELHGIIMTNDGNYNIGKVEGQDIHIIYNDKNLSTPEGVECGMEDDGVVYTEEMISGNPNRAPGDCIRVYVEIDDDIVSQKGGASAATNYVTGLFNESITLYANDGITMAISEIFAWTTNSPYSSTSSSGMLSDFQAATGAFNGDLSHLVSYQASGGIAAGFSGICNSNVDNSKCFSSISSSYANVPTYSFSVMVVTHEMGHLIGSRHTHACVWNGNGTAIDGCAGGTEGSCSVPGSPSSGGTIMSYCHLTTGIDFTQGFGPQPGNVVRNTVDNASCLSPCDGSGGPTCFDGEQNGDETGVDCGGSNCPACPTPCTDNIVTVTINLDNYPEETSWSITNAGGSVLASGGTYAAQPDGSTVTEEVCLVDGCFNFTINDSYGDGICCGYGNGSYAVTDASGTTLASGGSFASSETTNFCLGGGPAPTCDDGIQNGSETGVDCGGPDCDACPTCDDGVQNGNETGVDCGGPDCDACPTCDDGIQNGNETGVDCGGPDCDACPTGGTDEIFGHFFESGWDGWADGGSDCARVSSSRSYEGSYSIRLRDNSGTRSAMTSSAYDVSSYSQLDIEFFFYANSMETGEDFWVRYYDGSSWNTVATYVSGSSFTGNGFYTATVTINSAAYNFPSNAQFRFQCDASTNSDQIYIDAVTVTGSSGAMITDTEPIVSISEVERPTEVMTTTSFVTPNEVSVFPNPAQDFLNVRSEEVIKSIQVISVSGQLIRMAQPNTSYDKINISDLESGMYYIQIETENELITQKFVKM